VQLLEKKFRELLPLLSRFVRLLHHEKRMLRGSIAQSRCDSIVQKLFERFVIGDYMITNPEWHLLLPFE
jgi:hypothetical protein